MATKLPVKKTLDEQQLDCEVAAEVLSECFAYFAKQLAEEKRCSCPNEDKLITLENELRALNKQKLELGIDKPEIVNHALYFLAPLLRKNSL